MVNHIHERTSSWRQKFEEAVVTSVPASTIGQRFVFVTVALLTGALGVPFSAGAQEIQRRVTVVEESGGAIAGARWVLRSSQGTVLQQGGTDAAGAFTIAGLPPGTYWLEVAAPAFQERRMSVELSAREAPPLDVSLGLAGFRSEVTVTAQTGIASDIEEAGAVVTVRSDDFRTRPLSTIGSALDGAPGVMVQQSTYGQSSPFLRGLTGYQVLNLVDGIRFNNSTFRSGPNQYLAFVDPSQVQQIEAMLGPASSQFGSDALGGAIHVLTPRSHFGGSGRVNVKGGVSVFGGTADQSGGGDAGAAIATQNISWNVGGSWRRLNDLRAGDGSDSHHVLRRFFGLSDPQIEEITGTRQLDTGFAQSGFNTKVAARLGHQQSLTSWYQYSDQQDVRGYKDLWGGLGRLRSDFDPQRLHFFYTRYEKLDVGGLDWLTGTFSLNSQGDGSIRQGLRTTDPIVDDDVRVGAFGYAVQAGVHVASRQALVFGAEIYDEHIDAERHQTDPATGATQQRRALYPNGSRYRTAGLFVQDTVDIVRGAARGGVKANFGARFTRVDVDTFADRNLDDVGQSLGVVDSSQSFQNWAFNVGLTWQATEVLAINALVGRGFRAPNLNDLGALGLNDLGYEVPAQATVGAGAFVGASDGEGVLSSGRRVSDLEAESLMNYEVGAVLRWRGLYARAHAFDAELTNPIVRRTLTFPIDQLPATLAGLPVTMIPPTSAQRVQGVASVATAFDPRAVKAFVNDGSARYYGIDALMTWRLSPRWFTETSYSYLVGHDLHPTRPVRRLPPQQGGMSIRFQPGGRRLSWIGASALLSGAQKELSGGDVTDERIGAARRRTDISDFFRGGLIRPFLSAGNDGSFGTADDVFALTNETVAQIRDRVLPIGATINGVTIVDDGTRVPLYLDTSAFASLSLEAGVSITSNLNLNLAITNVLDRNYRIHGSGVDAPGINVYARLTASY